MMNNSQDDVYVCPSFSSYSSDRLAETAVRVAGGDEDFEFAEEFFHGAGQIRTVFPVFNRNLLLDGGGGGEASTSGGENAPVESSVVVPLSRLFIEEDRERDSPPSCSSSEADELENIPAGTYCVWRPKLAEPSLPSQCRKSKSTGSASKRWKFRDLLRRSKSDGKDSFVFLHPKQQEDKSYKSTNQTSEKANAKRSSSPGGAAAGAPGSPSAHEAFYVRNRAMKEGDKKKSYLPYRQGLVGIFANVNVLPHF
ncbi:hypothetical protein ABFX02_11G124300 [Erythranthe guttata]